MYREALRQCWRMLRMLGCKDALDVFIEELQTLQFAGLHCGMLAAPSARAPFTVRRRG